MKSRTMMLIVIVDLAVGHGVDERRRACGGVDSFVNR